MTTTNAATTTARQAARTSRATARSAPPLPNGSLSTVATQPEIDPCDLACDAMPGFVCGDLTYRDESWLLGHAAGCRYCSGMLQRYERIDDMLDRLHRFVVETPPPPPPAVRAARAAFGRVDSPIGPLFLAASEKGLCEISFGRRLSEEEFRRELEHRGWLPVPDQMAIQRIAEQLREYFEGRRNHFEVPLDFAGITPFTRSVLNATAEVPFGQVCTYRDIAERVGKPRATRAVGSALNRNPIPVVIPCHRVVGSDGSLVGYGGGIDIKKHLLHHEGVRLV
ncbi:MAG: methylated-DNA--[protein]-cysteine S-methyltransferase [Thermomicrobiales bacterium]